MLKPLSLASMSGAWMRGALLVAVLVWSGSVRAQQVIVAVNAGESSRVWRQVVVAEFAKQTGIQPQIFETALPAASIAQAGGHPDFDAAQIATYSIPRLAGLGLLEPLTPDDIPAIRKVPERFWPRLPDGKLAGIPLYFSIYGIAYNTELAKAADFQSWNDLLAPKWRGQVSLTRPIFLAPYDTTLFAKLNGGDERNPQPGYDFIQKLLKQTLSVYTSMASLEAQLSRGEIVAAPFYSAEVMSVRRSGAKEIAFTVPKEGGLVLSYFIGIPKGAPHRTEALRLLNALLDQHYQEGFAQEAGWWPMNPAVTLPPTLVQEMGGTQAEMMQRNIYPDWNEVGLHLEERIRALEDMFRKGP